MFSHIDDKQQPRMVDVSGKSSSWRTATAGCTVRLPKSVQQAFSNGEYVSHKGPVVQTAIIAGVMAAKQTSQLIPFCHPLGLEKCDIDIDTTKEGDLTVVCQVGVHHRTGAEMEALTGASVAALTVYDMCKGLSHDISISDLRLHQKSGGKRDYQLDEDQA